jgi:GTP pyrophosphokinase
MSVAPSITPKPEPASPTPEELFQKLASAIQASLPNPDIGLLRKAYEFAARSHGEQKRHSGEPYITHPIEVATIVAGLNVDMASIIAAILHDVVEDTDISLSVIEKEFGKTIADLVDGLTKIGKIEFRSNQERLAENFRKMVMAMGKDLRVIIVKLADRLHNMRTIKVLPPAKRRRIAQETMDIYTPLANRLGIYGIKSELEDLCLRQLKPEIYDELKQKIQSKKAERFAYIEDVKKILTDELKKYGFANLDVTGRPKHFYSIYKKMIERQLNFEDIHDLFAFRIIVDSVKDCYEALGVVHAMWKPMPGRFKDYIAMPKANGYQSLHTTVIRPSGDPCEIQIRTLEMHKVCEFGVAAHWSYKERGSAVAAPNEALQRMGWLKQIVEWQSELKDPSEFLEAVRVDLFEEEIFVFTPKGDVMRLPVGATALDFAFEVHTAIGISTVGAKVNGRMVPLKKDLKSGDIVEIVTSSKQKPSKDWLSFVTTSKAKNRIRAHLRTEQREKSKSLGRDLLSQALSDRSIDLEKLQKSNDMETLIRGSKEANFDDMIVAFGYGRLNPKELLDKVWPPKDSKALQTLAEHGVKETKDLVPVVKRTGKGRGILVGGLDDILVSLARCCNPLPGEDISGFITRGRGVTIHRASCPRALDSDPERQVEVTWGHGEYTQSEYLTNLKITCRDRPGILADVTTSLSFCGGDILKAQVNVGRDGTGVIDFELRLRNSQQLQTIIQKIETINSVIKVERRTPGYSNSKRQRKKKR